MGVGWFATSKKAQLKPRGFSRLRKFKTDTNLDLKNVQKVSPKCHIQETFSRTNTLLDLLVLLERRKIWLYINLPEEFNFKNRKVSGLKEAKEFAQSIDFHQYTSNSCVYVKTDRKERFLLGWRKDSKWQSFKILYWKQHHKLGCFIIAHSSFEIH